MKKTAAGCIPTPPRINPLHWARLALQATALWPSSLMAMAITYRTRPPKFWNNKGLKLGLSTSAGLLHSLPTVYLSAIDGAQKVLIVDECRGTGGQSEALLSMLTERSDLPAARLAAEDSFIATGPAYAATLPSRDSIVAAATKLWNAL